MKYQSHLLFLVLLMPLAMFSQNTLSYPTDIVFDDENLEYYVSNWANVDTSGFILKLNSAGDIVENFYSALDLPGGLCLVGDTLYVLNNKDLYGGGLPSYLLGIDKNTGQLIVEKEIGSGGIYLDMVTTDNKGYLYITDSENSKIYKYDIQSQTFIDFVTNINKPIGICYNYIDDKIMFTITKKTISYIASISRDGSDQTNEFYHLGYLEGITMAQNGDYYMSSWSGNDSIWGFEPVFKAPHEFQWKSTLNDDNNRPFGLCIGYNSHLAVCNWGSHTIKFLSIYLGENEFESQAAFSLYPNPTKGDIRIVLSDLQTKQANVFVYDISGKEVYQRSLRSEDLIGEIEFDFSDLKAGTYFLRVENSKNVLNKKLIIY